MIFHQGRADGVRHTIIVDEIRIDDEESPAGAAYHWRHHGTYGDRYDRHVELRWDAVASPKLGRYVVYRSMDGGKFEPVGIQLPGH